MAKIISGRVRKTPQSGITSDRYEFLGLEQAEPDLGDPLIGPSAVSANPAPPGSQYLLVNVGGQTGKRYWLPSTSLTVGELSPGSFTIFNNDVQVGLANSFNAFNFVGTGVTVDFVGSTPDEQTGVATVRIQVTDILAPGNAYEIPYNDPGTGFLRGSTDVVFRNSNVGIGSTLPAEKLDVFGNINVSGQIGFNTAVVGFITADNSYFDISTIDDVYINNLNVGTSSTVVKTLNGNVGIGATLPQYKLDVFGSSRFGGNVVVGNDLQINNNLNVIGNITIGGTTAIVYAQELRVSDKDIVLGFTTDTFGNDVSNDTTANGGGIAIASTEGNPLVCLQCAGINTFPGTYKQLIWFKSGTFTGLNTDAWLSNYAIGIGSTQVPSGVRLATGGVQITDNDINVPGSITANTFFGDGSNLTNVTATNSIYANVAGIATYSGLSGIATYANVAGISTNVIGGIGSVTQLNVAGVSTFVGVGTFQSDLYVGGDLDVDGHTELDDLNVSGVSTFAGAIDANGDLDVDGFTELDATNISETLNVVGIATFASDVDINASIDVDGHTELDDLNVSGVSTFTNLIDVNAGADITGQVTLNDTLSVLGVSSFSDAIDVNGDLDVDGHTELDDVNVSGFLTATSASFSGNVSIAGTLTYEDVTNIDAIGIITARSGVRITGGGLEVVGVSTLGITTTTDLTTQNLYVSGLSTFVGVGTFQSDLYVSDNIIVDNINVTGISTLGIASATTLYVSGIITAFDFNSTSDQSLKTNIQTVDHALDIVSDLRGVSFDWKETDKSSYGVIAQELEQVLPELVGNGDIKTVNYNGLIGVLIEAVKELSARVEELESNK